MAVGFAYEFQGIPLKKTHIGYEIQGMFLETDLMPLARQDVPQQHQLHMQMPYQQPAPQQRYVLNQQSPFSNRVTLAEKNLIEYEIQDVFLESDLLPFARQDVPQQLHMQVLYQQPAPQQRYVSNQQSPFSNRGPSSKTDTVTQSIDDECLYPTYTNLKDKVDVYMRKHPFRVK